MSRQFGIYQLLALLVLAGLVWVGWSPGGDRLIIGVVGPLTGPAAPYGLSQRHGVRLAVDQINAAGGIQGRQVEAVFVDDANDKVQAAEAARDLIYNRQALALIGAISSDDTMNIQRLCERAEVPLLTAVSTNPYITRVNFRFTFRCLSDDDIQAAELARYSLTRLNLRRVGILHDSNKYGSQGARTYRALATRLGQEITSQKEFDGGTVNFLPQLEAIKASRPDGLLIWGLARESALAVRQARELGITVPVFGGDGMAPAMFVDLAGPAAEGTVLTYPFNPLRGGKRAQRFMADYRKAFDAEADSFAAHAYDGMRLLEMAMNKGGTDRRAIRDALAGISGYEGVTGKGGLDATGNETRPVELAQVKSGRVVPLTTGGSL